MIYIGIDGVVVISWKRCAERREVPLDSFRHLGSIRPGAVRRTTGTVPSRPAANQTLQDLLPQFRLPALVGQRYHVLISVIVEPKLTHRLVNLGRAVGSPNIAAEQHGGNGVPEMIAEKGVEGGVVRRVTRKAGRENGRSASDVAKDDDFIAIVDVHAEMIVMKMELEIGVHGQDVGRADKILVQGIEIAQFGLGHFMSSHR